MRFTRCTADDVFRQVSLRINFCEGQLISDYECDKLRPYHEIIVRLARALEISTDELLGVKPFKSTDVKISLKLQRRMQKIDTLPPAKQKVILQTIDTFIRGVEA